MRTTSGSKAPSLEAPVEPFGNVEKKARVPEDAHEAEPVGDNAKRIPAAQEELISYFEKFTSIPDPPPTVTPIRHDKRLSEKRGGQDY